MGHWMRKRISTTVAPAGKVPSPEIGAVSTPVRGASAPKVAFVREAAFYCLGSRLDLQFGCL